VSLSGTTINLNSAVVEIIPACVAGSAYYLLTILNLTTPMNFKKRVLSLLFSYGFLLIINILRIFIASVLFLTSNSSFNLFHDFFWYFLSLVFVIGIWFLSVYLFKISPIPVYSDFKFILKNSKKSKTGN
jgi:exosortase/archaeosortase family protein